MNSTFLFLSFFEFGQSTVLDWHEKKETKHSVIVVLFIQDSRCGTIKVECESLVVFIPFFFSGPVLFFLCVRDDEIVAEQSDVFTGLKRIGKATGDTGWNFTASWISSIWRPSCPIVAPLQWTADRDWSRMTTWMYRRPVKVKTVVEKRMFSWKNLVKTWPGKSYF